MQRFDCQLELKGAPNDDMTFEGYGAVFRNTDSYGDVIEPGAFADTLRQSRSSGQWPAMLSQHGGMALTATDMMPIGVWLDMAEDGKGLWMQGKLADTPRGQEAYTLMKMKPRPALNGLSIGFMTKEAENGTKPNDPRRRLKKIDLIEVSIVTTPANPKARVTAVKADNIGTIREFEDFLRDVGGYSHAAAKAIAAGGFKAKSDPRDEDDTAELLAAIQRASAVLHP